MYHEPPHRSHASTAVPAERRRVAIVYPFFAHYRQPLLRELLLNGQHDYVLAGSKYDPVGGIPTMELADEPRFIATPLAQFRGRLLWQGGLIKLALRSDIDCLIYLGNAEFLSTWASALIARLRGRRVLFWTHGWLRRERGLKAGVRNAFYGIAHGLLLYGEHARCIGIERGFDPDELHVVYNSLDVQQQRQLRARITEDEVRATRHELFGAAQTPIVIAVGRLTWSKRFDLLIDAAATLTRSGHPVNVLIVGTGPAEQSLRAQAAGAGVKVVFFGPCYDEPTLARLFLSANVTVSPGNVGLTCMHSLGYGVPVITHDNAAEQGPEWEAITPGVTGALFSQNGVAALAEAIRQWTQDASIAAATRRECIRIIDERYHPAVQRQLIDAAAH